MKTITIGRSSDNTIILDHEMISRHHAMLRVYPTGKMEILDLKSKNGVTVNGRGIRPNVPYPVKRNDSVEFAHAERLDWNLVPNPRKYLNWVIAGVVALIIILIGVWFALSRIDTPRHIDELDGAGNGAVTDTVKSKQDTTKSDKNKNYNLNSFGLTPKKAPQKPAAKPAQAPAKPKQKPAAPQNDKPTPQEVKKPAESKSPGQGSNVY